jgi:Ca2+-binding RTX toxin-like protein
VDKIVLAHEVFTAAGPLGALAEEAFYQGAAAHDASDRIIYNPATGGLYYDEDGTGPEAAVLFVKFGVWPSVLAAGDFLIS